MINWVVIWQ